MNHEIKRATGLLVLEAVNSNPNGDPDRDGEPRQRDNGRGEISPVSFKRKLRDLIEQNDKDEHDTPFFKALPEKFSGKENEKQYLILEHRGRKPDQRRDEGKLTAERETQICRAILGRPCFRQYLPRRRGRQLHPNRRRTIWNGHFPCTGRDHPADKYQ